eukprot:715797-Amphidinium_carterae.1
MMFSYFSICPFSDAVVPGLRSRKVHVIAHQGHTSFLPVARDRQVPRVRPPKDRRGHIAHTC